MKTLAKLLNRWVGFNPVVWLRARSAMDARVAEFLPQIPEKGGKPDAMVVIAPWLGTAVPWFILAIALMMARRGATIRFVVDDLPYASNTVRHRVVSGAVRAVMKRVATRFEVHFLRDFDPAPLTQDDETEIDRLARLNATWTLKGEMPQEGRQGLIDGFSRQNAAAQAHIATLFKQLPHPEFLFTPGGIFGHSGLWMRAARQHGIRIGSFDAGGQQAMLIASDGMACQLRDIPRAFAKLKPETEANPDALTFALERAEEEIAKRREGKDKFSSQAKGSDGGGDELEGGFLIALNSSWDAAALGPHRAFPTNTDWIVGTVRYLLDNTQRPVIVRQHPVERLPIAYTSEDYAKILSRAFGEHERLHFIAASDPINSYALMDKISAVIVHTSTLGMEAVAYGRPVITGSDSYYSGLGFVNFADNRAAYEQLLSRADAGELAVTGDMQRDARLCYYITQCCNWVFTPFNPANFMEWVVQPLSHWVEQPEVERVLDSLITGDPIATINHRLAMANTEQT